MIRDAIRWVRAVFAWASCGVDPDAARRELADARARTTVTELELVMARAALVRARTSAPPMVSPIRDLVRSNPGVIDVAVVPEPEALAVTLYVIVDATVPRLGEFATVIENQVIPLVPTHVRVEASVRRHLAIGS